MDAGDQPLVVGGVPLPLPIGRFATMVWLVAVAVTITSRRRTT